MANTAIVPSKLITRAKETLISNYSLGEQGPREARVLSGGAITNFHNPTPRLPGTEKNKSLEPPRTVVIQTGDITLPVEDLFGNAGGTADYLQPSSQQLKLTRDQQLALARGKISAK